MRYFDTSFLAPLFRDEANSSVVPRLLASLPAGQLATSHWTQVEVASLLARDVRMGVISSAEAREAETTFDDVVRRSFVTVLPDEGDYDLARRYLHTYETGLRAGDALHLAVAAKRRATSIYTFDKAMLRAGESLGLPMSDGTGLN
jgi:predicted nucleic acid-binding protein